MDETTRAAFQRLLRYARSDTGQSRRIANFILAWWNADDLGGFDLADIFAVDRAIGQDMATVFTWLAGRSNAEYPVHTVPRSRRSSDCGVRRSGRTLRRRLDRGPFEITTVAARRDVAGDRGMIAGAALSCRRHLG